MQVPLWRAQSGGAELMSQVVATGATVRASDLSRGSQPEGEMQDSTSSLEVGQSGRNDLSGKKREVRIRAFSQADGAWTRSSTDRLPPPGHAPTWEAHSETLLWHRQADDVTSETHLEVPPDGHIPLKSAP